MINFSFHLTVLLKQKMCYLSINTNIDLGNSLHLFYLAVLFSIVYMKGSSVKCIKRLYNFFLLRVVLCCHLVGSGGAKRILW